MNPPEGTLLPEAKALLAEGRWDDVEDLCRSSASRSAPDAALFTLFALLGVVHAKRGNMEMAFGFLDEACRPAHGPQGPEAAARCLREFLAPDQAAVLQAGLARRHAGHPAFGASGTSGDALPPDALGAWPYMNEIEVQAMRSALGILTGRVDALEWGAGHSTFFFARGLPPGSVWSSIEHNPEWFARLQREPLPGSGARIALHHVPNSGPFQDGVEDGDIRSFPEYIRFPRNIGASFRFILVDGRARVECLQEGWKLLARDGIMVLHDGERTEYRPGHPADGYRLEVSNPALKERKAICFFAKDMGVFRTLTRALRDVLPVFVSLVPGMPGAR